MDIPSIFHIGVKYKFTKMSVSGVSASCLDNSKTPSIHTVYESSDDA